MIKVTLKTENKHFVLNDGQAPRGIREGNNRPHKIKVEIDHETDRKGIAQLIHYLADLETAMQDEPLEIYFKNARERFCQYTKMVQMNNNSLAEVDEFLIAYDNAIQEINRLKNRK